MGAPEHPPWRVPPDDLHDSSYQGTVLDFSIFQLAGRPPTYVKATPASTRRLTRRGKRGSSAFRRDRQIGGRPSILPSACAPEDGNVGKGSARNRPHVSGSGIPQGRPAVDRLLTVEHSTGRKAAVAHKRVAHGDHDRVRFLPALPQASRRRGMIPCRRSRASFPWEASRPQNRSPLVSSASDPPYSRDRSIPWFCSGGPGPPTARYRTTASREP